MPTKRPATAQRHISNQRATLCRAEVCEELGISSTTLTRWMAKGQFIKPRKIGENTVRWLRAEVTAWLATRPESDIAPPPPPAHVRGSVNHA